MTSIEFVQKVLLKISKYKLLVLLTGVGIAVLLYFYSKNIPSIHSSRATVFPLTASNDNPGSGALTSILGISESPKSFSQEASINIIELALSRTTREAVALERVENLGNRTIAELVIANFNKHKSLTEEEIKIPSDQKTLASIGGSILQGGLFAKVNKNGILEISYSSTDPSIVSPVSYVFIDKISAFYKDLKIRKAQNDYNFTIRKIDSLQQVLNVFDRRAVRMNNTTLFTPPDRIQYTIPKENLASDKERVMRQRDASANNREEALWRLQKVTPIIAILDKPDPPFTVKSPPVILFTFVGFLIGVLISILLLITGIIYRYVKLQVNTSIFREPIIDTTVSTTV